RVTRAAELTHELKGRGSDFGIGSRRLEVGERLNAAAHGSGQPVELQWIVADDLARHRFGNVALLAHPAYALDGVQFGRLVGMGVVGTNHQRILYAVVQDVRQVVHGVAAYVEAVLPEQVALEIETLQGGEAS